MEEKVIGTTEKVLIFLVLFSLIFLQRFAIPVEEFQISLVLLFSVVSVMILFFSNKIEIDKKKTCDLFMCDQWTMYSEYIWTSYGQRCRTYFTVIRCGFLYTIPIY